MTELETLMGGKSFEDYVKELADKSLADIKAAVDSFVALEGKTTDAMEKGKVADARIALEKAYRAKEAVADKLDMNIKALDAEKKRIRRELVTLANETRQYMYYLGMKPGDAVFGGYKFTDNNEKKLDTANNQKIRAQVESNPQTKDYYNTKYLECLAAYDAYKNELDKIDKNRLEYTTRLNIINKGGHIDGLADYMLKSDPELPKEKEAEVIDETKKDRETLESLMTKYGLITAGVNSYEDIAKMELDKLQTFIDQLTDFKKEVSKLDRSIGAKAATEAFYDLGKQVKKLEDSRRNDLTVASTLLTMKNKDIEDINAEIVDNNAKIEYEREQMALKQIEALKYKYYLGYATKEEVELFNKEYVNKEKARTGAARVNNPINMTSANANKAKAESDPAMRAKFENLLQNEESHIQQHVNNIKDLTEKNNSLNATIEALSKGELTPKYQTMVDKYGKELHGMAFMTGEPAKGLDPIDPDKDKDLDPDKDKGLDPIDPDKDKDLDPDKDKGLDPIDPDKDKDLDPDKDKGLDPIDPDKDTDLNPEPENKEPEQKDGKGKKPRTGLKERPRLVKGLKIAGTVIGIAALAALTGGIAYFAISGGLSAMTASALATPTMSGLVTGSLATVGIQQMGGKSK